MPSQSSPTRSSFAPVAALVATLTVTLLVACGSRSDVPPRASTIAECPVGYVCCPEGEDCTPSGGNTGSGYPTQGSGSASSSGSSSGGTGLDASDAGLTPPGSPQSSDDAGYPEGSTPPSTASITVLDYQVIDAKFSQALSSLVIASSSPSNTLHIYDTSKMADRAVPLPAAPTAVAVDATGLHAAVAFDGNVSWVDLTAGMVTTTCPISSDSFDIVLTKTGTAYVMPLTDQWVSLHVIDSTCNETLEGGAIVRAASHLALHPSETALFDADQGLSPSSINRCDLEESPVECDDALDEEDWGTYPFCGALWISADGARIYSACGVTLRVPGDPNSATCTYGGTLDGVDSIQYLSEAPDAKRVVLVPGNPYSFDPTTTPDDDTVVRVHETDYLGFVAQYELPPFPLTGTNTAVAHGRFVYTTPGMETIYAIVQADQSSGALNDFGIVTMTP
jgi:chitinase